MVTHNEFWWRFFPHKELTQIYISAALRSFAVAFLGVFIPLYLYKEQNYSLEQTLLFFILYSTLFAIGTPLAAKFAARFGARHSVLLSVPFYLVFVVLLYAFPRHLPFIMIASIVLGLSQAFYWIGMHLVFHHASHYKKRGEEVGKRGSISILGALSAPLISGLLIDSFGFPIVFALASLVLLGAAAVLFWSKDNHEPYHFSVRSVLNKDHWKDSLYFVSKGTYTITSGVLWPLFIFLILGSYFSLGVVGSLMSGISALLLYLVGKSSDHRNKRSIVRWIIGFDALAWLLRALVLTPLHVFAVTIAGGITEGTRESPLGALEYDKAKGEVAAYFVSREVFICLGRILMLAFVLLMNNITAGFVFQGILTFAALLF